jgi:hypothetical protein
MLTLRLITPTDLPAILSVDIKSQEFPLDKEQIGKLLSTDKLSGVIVSNEDPTRPVDKVGFALFSTHDEGKIVDVARFSVLPSCIDDGVVEKIVENLRRTVGNPPSIRYIISEYEIGSPFFNKLVSIGFLGIGLAPNKFREYGLDVDGIKLVMP